MPPKLPRDAISLFSGSSGIIQTVPGDDGFEVWSPSARRDERIRKRRSQYLCRIDACGHASIFFVLFFIVMAAIIFGRPVHYRGSVDLPHADHPNWMPGALREDAMHVGVTRDGKVYFDSHRISPDQLPDEIRSNLRTGAEKRIYISADARAMYRDVKTALDGIRQSGVQHVSLITVASSQ
jgi:biopolymer transport protein ExbD